MIFISSRLGFFYFCFIFFLNLKLAYDFCIKRMLASRDTKMRDYYDQWLVVLMN